MKCPYCKEIIDDDSLFCDQCGKELSFCPDCKTPHRGSSCPVCGKPLVDGMTYFKPTQPARTIPPVQPVQPVQPIPPAQTAAAAFAPQGTSVQASLQKPYLLSAPGMQIQLKAGPFGRTSGIYPEFFTCNYISGRHGEFIETPSGWNVLDYGSTNGTYVNGVRIAPGIQTPLKHGDNLKIATLIFTVE